MTRFVFVSGTDTGVGKTLVSTGLARALVARGRRVMAVKPIETGCDETIAEGEDGARLARAAGQAEPRGALVRLRAPVTPAVAAERENVHIDLRDLVRSICTVTRDAEVAIVEGAGGLLSPITWDFDFTDLVRALDGASIVLVAQNRLGVIHQVRATSRCATHASLGLDAVVLSDGADGPPRDDASIASNVEVIRRYAGDAADRVFVLPRCNDEDAAATHLAGLADIVIRRLG